MKVWVPGSLRHLTDLRLQPEQAAQAALLPDLVEGLTPELWVRSFLVDTEPVFVMGAVPVRQGFVTVWAVLTGNALTHGVRIARGAHRFLCRLQEREGLYRAQSYMNPAHVAAIRWIEHLGFQWEGTHRKAAADGGDLAVYARIF